MGILVAPGDIPGCTPVMRLLDLASETGEAEGGGQSSLSIVDQRGQRRDGNFMSWPLVDRRMLKQFKQTGQSPVSLLSQ